MKRAVFERNSLSRPRSIQHSSKQGGPKIVCFRCGVCCTRYQPQLSFVEAKRIADALGLSLDEFRDRYVDESWPGPDTFLIDHHNGACVFLEHIQSSGLARCLIYPVRPSSCKEWVPSLHRQECQEGLLKCWGLTVDPSGQPKGPGRKIQEFLTFLESIA